MSLKQGISLTIRNVVVALTIGVLFASTNALAATGFRSSDWNLQHNEQLFCLAKNVYFEARGESTRGKEAVAHVTLNRVESHKFPNSICNVVKQRSRNTCQFSWVCKNYYRNIPWNSTTWKESVIVAKQVLDGNTVDPTNGAMFFHATYVRPSWSKTLKKTAGIGNHVFYKAV